jgi:uncharacterized pyridoxal phosphate-containing UPF0001 family protein
VNRLEELAENLAEVEERIAKACEVAGRDRGEVMLLAVTKTWPASDVEILWAWSPQLRGEPRSGGR